MRYYYSPNIICGWLNLHWTYVMDGKLYQLSYVENITYPYPSPQVGLFEFVILKRCIIFSILIMVAASPAKTTHGFLLYFIQLFLCHLKNVAGTYNRNVYPWHSGNPQSKPYEKDCQTYIWFTFIYIILFLILDVYWTCLFTWCRSIS